MFPTFLSFTQRHPRATAVIGLTIFILSAILFAVVNTHMREMKTSSVEERAVPLQDEIIIGDTFPHDYEQRYDFQNTTYDMTGDIIKIEGDILTIEDTTPKAPTDNTTSAQIELRLSSDTIYGYGYEFAGIDTFNVGDSVFLKTTRENNEILVQELFKVSTPDVTNEIN